MAVNRQAYTIDIQTGAAGASALADKFRQVFIDAGLMTEWHDAWSAANGQAGTSYYRVLKLTQDANKTYGSTYVLFCFFQYQANSNTYVYLTLVTNTWNTTSHTATGTQYLDYFINPNSGFGHSDSAGITWFAAGSGGTLKIIRYTSGSSTIVSIPGYGSPLVFQSSIDTQPSWVDLAKTCIAPVFSVSTDNGSSYANTWRCLYFAWPTQLRRFVFPGRSPGGTASGYFSNRLISSTYMASGCALYEMSGTAYVNDPASYDKTYIGAVHIPWGDGTLMPGSSAPWGPIMTGVNMAAPLNLKLPSDFGIGVIPQATKKGAAGDRLTISANEVWEVVTLSAPPNGYNSIALLARTT